jgi:hypothetical protein
MTAAEGGASGRGALCNVVGERETDDECVAVELSIRMGLIQADLRIGANVGDAQPLTSNVGLSFMGVTLVGDGFRIERTDFDTLDLNMRSLPPVVRPYRSGKELTQTARERWIIDFS